MRETVFETDAVGIEAFNNLILNTDYSGYLGLNTSGSFLSDLQENGFLTRRVVSFYLPN